MPPKGSAELGFAELEKIASPNMPNTDQMAMKVNAPIQIAPQFVLFAE